MKDDFPDVTATSPSSNSLCVDSSKWTMNEVVLLVQPPTAVYVNFDPAPSFMIANELVNELQNRPILRFFKKRRRRK